MTGTIYSLTNIINGKTYIGQTIQDLNERIRIHLKDANNNSDYAIHRAIRKYGFNNFIVDIFEVIENKDRKKLISILNNYEKYYIEKINCLYYGYNMTSGGDANFIITEENKNKMSEIKKGKNNPFYGKQHTDLSKKKMSEIKLGF